MCETAERPPRTIALAVDQSEWSEQAFEWFIENIYHKDDKVILVHVVEQPHLPLLADALVLEEWRKEVKKLEEKLKALEKKYVERCQELNIDMRFKLEQGKPGEKICELAQKERATMIMLGSRGAGLLRRTVLGSVSTFVIHHTRIPVVICPKGHK